MWVYPGRVLGRIFLRAFPGGRGTHIPSRAIPPALSNPDGLLRLTFPLPSVQGLRGLAGSMWPRSEQLVGHRTGPLAPTDGVSGSGVIPSSEMTGATQLAALFPRPGARPDLRLEGLGQLRPCSAAQRQSPLLASPTRKGPPLLIVSWRFGLCPPDKNVGPSGRRLHSGSPSRPSLSLGAPQLDQAHSHMPVTGSDHLLDGPWHHVPWV